MSLLVWLPLTNDLTNQGLSSATFSYVNNNGKLSINASGKLGKCYERTASGYADLFRSSTTFNLSGDLSMCCWAYVSATVGDTANGLITNHDHGNNTGVGITVKQVSTTDYRICCSTGTGSSRTFYTYYGTTNIKDAWHHLALTYSKSAQVLQLWVDGVVEYTLNNYANAAGNNTFDLFNWSTGYGGNNQYRPVCKLNDVRLYDHCLSTKAVKELSKGLVCHYTLGGKPCDNVLTNSTGYNGTTDWGGVISTATENGIPYLISQRTNTTSTSRTFVSHSAITSYVSSWAAGDKFTISGYYRVPSSETYAVTANLFIRWTFSDSSFSDTGFSTPSASTVVKDTWIRFEYTYAVPANYTDGAVNFYLSAFSQGLSTVHWKYIKLEKGARATNWIPNSSDAEYTTMGYNSTTVYDSSGYNYHGTINTAMTVSSNTARYSTSTKFNGTNNAITIPYNTMCPTNIFTMNIWFYKDVIGSKNYETLFGGPSGFEMDTRAGTATTLSLYMASTRGSILYEPLEFNKWNMITMVRDGTNELYYVNGELKKTITAKSMPTGTYFIGAWRDVSSQNYYGLISDFRLYSTCLSADDIKSLYQVGASIDKSGNMYAYELREV